MDDVAAESEKWLRRIVLPDLPGGYPAGAAAAVAARSSVICPPGTIRAPAGAAAFAAGGGQAAADPARDPSAELLGQLTQPGGRPAVIQRAMNFQLSVTTVPQPLLNQPFYCETIVLDVVSSAANSVFFGFNSAVTSSSGMELRAGQPIALRTENQRELWELQRSLEYLAALMARDRGLEPPAPFKSPRVVFNAADLYVVAAATTALAVVLFQIPELQ
jgi:hypothetical protein